MRILSKISLFLSVLSILTSSAFASSPFDNILGRAPDLAATDIHQETRFLYLRVCNFGGSITDSDTTLALAMKKAGGGTVSSIESVLLDTNECHEFRVASVDDLGITTSGTYTIQAGVVLKDGRMESVKDNNKISKSVNIIYPSLYTGTEYNSSYNYSTSNNYNYNCNSSTGYCPNNTTNGSTTYYCIPGTTNCSTAPYATYNNNSYYNNNCNSSNNYCGNTSYNGSYTYYRANICPAGDYACNNSYYNSTNTPYQYNNTYCTYSNNYCNTNYRTGPSDTTNCTTANDFCRAPNTNYSNGSNYNYNNNYNYNYNNNNQYDLPDLVVQRVYQNSSDKRIIAQICNQGGDMRNSVSVRTDFTSAGRTSNVYNTVQMARGQCTSSVVSVSPAELGIIYGGNYTVGATVDTSNNVSEQNESNNSLSQQLFLETDRNQKADLTVDRISTNDNNRTLLVHVCNVGDDMVDYNNWVIEISNTSNNSTIRNSGYRLSRGQCADINTSYASLGIYQS